MTDSLVSIRSRTEADRLIPPPGTFEIDPVHTFVTRRDFGLVHDLEHHTGSLQVARDVTIEIDAEAVLPL